MTKCENTFIFTVSRSQLWVLSKLRLTIHTVPEQSQRRFPKSEAIFCSQHAEVGCFHIGIGSLRKRRKCYGGSSSFLFCREVRTTKSTVTFFCVLYVEFGSSFKRLTWRSVHSLKSDSFKFSLSRLIVLQALPCFCLCIQRYCSTLVLVINFHIDWINPLSHWLLDNQNEAPGSSFAHMMKQRIILTNICL